MEKVYSYNENLPNIYSQNTMYLKSSPADIKNNWFKNIDNSLNNNNNIGNNSLYNENRYFIKNKEKSNNYLKITINNNDEIKLNKNNILTKYNSYNNGNSSNYKNTKLKDVLEKLKMKNKKIHSFRLPKKTSEESDNLFSNSYYNFIKNLKKKRDYHYNNINNKNEHKEKYDESDKGEIKSSFASAIHSIKTQNTNLEENHKINLDIISPKKTFDNSNIISKTPNKLKLSNNTINNTFRINASTRNNVFGVSNDQYSLYSNSIQNKNLSKKIVCPICQRDIEYYRFKSHFNLHPSKIFDWLYLGSYRNACDIKDLKDLKINYILNCAVECENKNLPYDINCYHAKINDMPYFQLTSFFEKTNAFINKAKISGGNILIHCQLGISRSTACLIAYMIKYLGYTTLTALQFIKKKRPQVMPNFGFIQQLKNYENKINMNKNYLKLENTDDISNTNYKKRKKF